MTPAPVPSSTAVSDDWFEVAIDAPEEEEETVVAALHASGSTGAWVATGGVVRGYYPPGTTDPTGAFGEAWRELTGAECPHALAVRRVPAIDWTERWRETLRPIAVGPRLWVAPPEAAPPPGGWPPGAVVVRIRSGLGFGTGAHPTTRALLRWLEAEPGFASLLDVGTGSGVLAIAAALLGAETAVGLDVDALALDNAADNVRTNAASDAVRLVRGTLDAVREMRFDRVLANLDRATLDALLPGLAHRCAAGGRVGLAGLLAHDRDATLDRARAAGLALVDEVVATDGAGGDAWWSGWLIPEAA